MQHPFPKLPCNPEVQRADNVGSDGAERWLASAGPPMVPCLAMAMDSIATILRETKPQSLNGNLKQWKATQFRRELKG
jgi:hypothetical protein